MTMIWPWVRLMLWPFPKVEGTIIMCIAVLSSHLKCYYSRMPKKLGVYLDQVAQRHLPAVWPSASANSSAVQVLRQATDAWRAVAGDTVARHVAPVHYANGRLLLHADASIWLNKLRHEQQALIKQLRIHAPFAGVTELHVRVVPPSVRRAASDATLPPRLTAQATYVLRSAAATTSDPALSAALLNLARPAKG